MTPAEAFAAIALAAVACDGSVDPHEVAMLRAQLASRHPYRTLSEERMGRLFEGLLDQLQAGGWRVLITGALPALTPNQQETALAVAAHLIHGDQSIRDEESRLLRELAAQMALPEGRAEQLLEAISVLHRDSLAP
ncbi:MAG: tellurite resistance TerB family protein [Cyanobacteriota bacterium]|nr:tellurite resistance TerB family protein [Cyanobacteriota bacterium]